MRDDFDDLDVEGGSNIFQMIEKRRAYSQTLRPIGDEQQVQFGLGGGRDETVEPDHLCGDFRDKQMVTLELRGRVTSPPSRIARYTP